MTFWFDMDGTIADLYGVANWLDSLIAKETRPYDIAKGIGNLSQIARKLNKLQKLGHEIGIISWTAKGTDESYNEKIALAKLAWLNRHLKSVKWNSIKIVPYGTNKKETCQTGILFDDEEGNRKAWGKDAFTPNEIVKVLNDFLR